VLTNNDVSLYIFNVDVAEPGISLECSSVVCCRSTLGGVVQLKLNRFVEHYTNSECNEIKYCFL